MKQPLRFARHLRLIVVAYLMFTSDFTVVAQQTPSALTGRKTISGIVLDIETDQPIVGAQVWLKDTTIGSTTNSSGRFEISFQGNYTVLNVSFLGYETREIVFTPGNEITIKLSSSSTTVDEVVVVGYGVQKKASVVGAISTISVNDIKAPVAKISNNLAGQLAGVVSVQRSGEPGVGSTFWIRGINTFGSAKTPLILVDGIERDMDLVNVDDIKEMSILKDASATAIYGVRGANGVVMITTRDGVVGKPKVSLSFEAGMLSPTKIPEMLNSVQFAKMYNEAYGSKYFSDEAVERYRTGSDRDLYPNVNWLDELYKKHSYNEKINLSISGGGSIAKYYISGSFYNENGLFAVDNMKNYDTSLYYQRYNFRSNVDVQVFRHTKVNINLGTSFERKNEPGGDTGNIWKYSLSTAPNAFPLYYSDGTLAGPGNNVINPYVELTQRGYREKFWNTATSTVNLQQDFGDWITPGLTANIKVAFDAQNYQHLARIKQPTQYLATGRDDDDNLIFGAPTVVGQENLSFSESASGTRSFYFEAVLNYARTFGKHTVGALFLYQQSQKNITSSVETNSEKALPYRHQGIAGRITYNFDNRYFIEGNFGYNGSENFAPEKRFGFFPSGSIGYVISEEAFMKKQKVVDYLKLRASIGLVGNDNISDNRFLYLSNSWLVDQLPSEKDYWNAYKNGYNFGFNNGNMIKGAIESRIGNPNVSWETALKQNYGIDVNFLNNRLKVSADIFFEDRKDILIKRQTIPITTNLTSDNLPVVNMGRVKNHGYEIDLKWEDVIKGKLHYYINANVSYNRNKIIFQDEVEPNEPYQWRTGQPVGTIFGYVADGFYNDSDFENGKLKEGLPKPTMDVSPGDVKYTDLNGDGLITDDDQRAIGNPTRPAYTWGLNYGADYKGFFFSMNWTAATERSLVLDYFFRKPFGNNANNALMQFHADNRWTPATAETATVPRFATKSMDYNSYTSSLWVKNGNFLKLKTLTIGYNFKERKALKKLGISQLGIKFSGYNLLTFDSFKIMDPECTPGLTDSYPIIKIYNIGINLTF